MTQTRTKVQVIRYWTIWIFSLSMVSILFVWGVLTVMRQFNGFVILGLGLLLYVFMAFMQAKRSTSPQRVPLFYTDPKDLGFEYQEVTFSSRDGMMLSGWFLPGQNGAGVILTHGYSANRVSCTKAARMLVRHGFNVLLYDLRGHGRSQGGVNTWGWLEVNDLLGALDYLQRRPGVDAGNIGALGFSLGGQITIRAAAQEDQLRAVMVDGSPLAVLADHVIAPGFSLRKLVFYPWLWLAYTFQVLLTGVRMPEGILQAVSKIAPRPLLLIAAGRGQEYLISRLFYQSAGEPKELHIFPDDNHGDSIRAHSQEYEQKLIGFFEQALVKRQL